MNTASTLIQEPCLINKPSQTLASHYYSKANPAIQAACKMQNSPGTARTDWIVDDNDPRASAATYTSTIPPRDDPERKKDTQLVQERYEAFPADAITSTPISFAGLFPSCRKLLVRHDDTTRDGNLNLRISTLVTESRGRHCEVILFHLRMLDLHERKFSLRRYCRQSGREVCHSSRKYRPEVGQKRHTSFPWVGFSVPWPKSNLQRKTDNSLRRQDSGYRSGMEDETVEKTNYPELESPSPRHELCPTNKIKLEFSNYAHVDVERRGSRHSKHYDYEYWSTKYQWRRSIRRDGSTENISYHLYDVNRPKPVAHIIPERLGPMEALDEETKGGWVPPVSIWISDASIFRKMSDIADVVIATGVVALVDDNIKRRWHSRERSWPSSPIASTFVKSVDSLVSTKLFDRVFQNRWSTGSQHINWIRQLVYRGHGS